MMSHTAPPLEALAAVGLLATVRGLVGVLAGVDLKVVSPEESLITISLGAFKAILDVAARVRAIGGDLSSTLGHVLLSREMRRVPGTGLDTLRGRVRVFGKPLWMIAQPRGVMERNRKGRGVQG